MLNSAAVAKILSSDSLNSTADIKLALDAIRETAEEWVGHDIVLELDERGWSVRYTYGSSYRKRLLADGGSRFFMPEDAIQALFELAAANEARAKEAEAVHAGLAGI